MQPPQALAKLRLADELCTSLEQKDVLLGYEEIGGGPGFHPSFKVVRGEGERYVAKRIPSYCDRILYKSLPGFRANIRGRFLH
jgi:hypothetical protein